MKKFEIKIPGLNVIATDTDAEIAAKVKAALPAAYLKLGEKMGNEMWKEIQKAFGGNSSDKSRFIKEQSREFVKGLSRKDKAEIESNLLETAVAERDALKGK